MRARRVVSGGFAAIAVLALSASAPATPPHPDTSASPSGAPLAGDASALDKSPLPKADEWGKATPVRLDRVSAAGATCNAVRVREWIRIRCASKTFAVSLLGGSNEGLAFWIGPEADGQPGEVQFPLRRGDRRVVQFWAYGKDADGGFQAKPLLVVQEQWVLGEPAPTVTAI